MNTAQTGGMPTPCPTETSYGILLGLERDTSAADPMATFSSADTRKVSLQLYPQETGVQNDTFPFHVLPWQNSEAGEAPRCRQAAIEFFAASERCGKKITNFHQVLPRRCAFDIRYAAESSSLFALAAITVDTRTPLYLRLRNISYLPIGGKAGRCLKVLFR
eukprot:1383660-Prorocentrum_lima.AAC.1